MYKRAVGTIESHSSALSVCTFDTAAAWHTIVTVIELPIRQQSEYRPAVRGGWISTGGICVRTTSG